MRLRVHHDPDGPAAVAEGGTVGEAVAPRVGAGSDGYTALTISATDGEEADVDISGIALAPARTTTADGTGAVVAADVSAGGEYSAVPSS